MPDNYDQIPFTGADFAENPEPRCQCILLLDTSGSMTGQPIKELNDGIVNFKDEIVADAMAMKRVELAIISFGPVKVETDFTTVDYFQPPLLQANGNTPMGEAIEKALSMIKERKEIYRQNAISYYRPWIFLITDGAPTDDWSRAANLVKDGEESRAFLFFAVGVKGANFEILSKISVRKPLELKGLRFRDLFSWLANSLSSVSRSNTDDKMNLVNPVTPEGWASI